MARYQNYGLSDQAVVKIPTEFKDEKQLQKAVVKYIRAAYGAPVLGVSFFGNKLGDNTQAAHRQMQEAKSMGFTPGWPDLIILSPGQGYNGLCLELKAKPGTVFLKNGGFAANDHAKEQALILEDLLAEGYLAVFAEGWDHALNILQWYFEGAKQPTKILSVPFGKKCRYTGEVLADGKALNLVF